MSDPLGMPNRLKPACAVAVAALALASMLAALGRMSHSVWFDESQTRLIARQPTLGGVVAQAMHERPYPPLFFLAVRYSLLVRDDELGLRLPAALFGALALLAVFSLGSALVDPLTGAVAAGLLVVTPGAFRYFVDGNAYTLLMLASALSTTYLWRAAHSDRGRDWALYAVWAIVGMGTHLLFAFHVGAQALAGLYLRSRGQTGGAKSYRRTILVMSFLVGSGLLWGVAYAKGGGMSQPLRLSRLFEIPTLVSMAGMYVGPQSFGGWRVLALWVPLQLAGAACLYRNRRRVFWALAILIAAPAISITLFARLTLPYVAYRHGIGIFPLACVVAACSWKLWPRRLAARAATAGVILAYGANGAAFTVSAGENTFGYQDFRGAAGYLSAHWSAGEPVVVLGRDTMLPLVYYWKSSLPIVVEREEPDIAGAVDRAMAASQPPVVHGWLVLSDFANQNPVTARFTESRRFESKGQLRRLTEKFAERGLRVCGSADFLRIVIAELRRGNCEIAP